MSDSESCRGVETAQRLNQANLRLRTFFSLALVMLQDVTSEVHAGDCAYMCPVVITC